MRCCSRTACRGRDLTRSCGCGCPVDGQDRTELSRRSGRSRPWNHFQDAIMSLLYVIGVLIVVGVLLWLVNNYIPMDSKIKSILNAVVVIVVVIWLLQAFGLLGDLASIRVGNT